MCDPSTLVTLEAMVGFPSPLSSISVTPKDKRPPREDGRWLSARWLQKILPFRVEPISIPVNILARHGELHLDINGRTSLRRTYGVICWLVSHRLPTARRITKDVEDATRTRKASPWWFPVSTVRSTTSSKARRGETLASPSVHL